MATTIFFGVKRSDSACFWRRIKIRWLSKRDLLMQILPFEKGGQGGFYPLIKCSRKPLFIIYLNCYQKTMTYLNYPVNPV